MEYRTDDCARNSLLRKHLAWMVLVALTTLGTTLQAGEMTGIVSFGDSLSDVGNTYLAGGVPPSPPYYDGHYSNGPIWLEYLAAPWVSPRPTPSLAGGLDNAWGVPRLVMVFRSWARRISACRSARFLPPTRSAAASSSPSGVVERLLEWYSDLQSPQRIRVSMINLYI